MGVSIRFELTGAGWADCRVAIDEQSVKISASYLSDALGDLIGAAGSLAEGASEATVSFAEEPGEWRWRLFRQDPYRLLVRIMYFPDTWTNKPDESGECRFEAECRLRTFCGAVLSESQRLSEVNGFEGYRELWSTYDFPIDRQNRLKLALGSKL